MNRISTLAGLLSKCALFCSVLLLVSSHFAPARVHAWLGSIPLALIGISYVVLQIRLRPNRRTLMSRLLLAGTFILWAVDQLLPPGNAAVFIGDLVVSAYVLDLFWMIQEQGETSTSST